MMVAGESDRAIRAAVDECLAGCYVSDQPLVHLVQFSHELRQEGWTEYDIRKVEQIARRLLAQVMTDGQTPAETA
jgi:hypothetical protein